LVTLAVADESPRVAIGEMLAEHRPVLLAAARLITLDEAEAQDIVQLTFDIALRRGHTLREPGSLRSWLLAVETREAVRRVRVMRRFLSYQSPPDHPAATLFLDRGSNELPPPRVCIGERDIRTG
jgi:DNA-directed RNA polymerase specialized sigma24 family protein